MDFADFARRDKPNREYQVRTIKLMPEFQCWPLWEASTGTVGNVDPESLPITRELKEELRRWTRIYDGTLNVEYPPDSKFETPEEELAFKKMGRALTRRLQAELGSSYVVVAHRTLGE